MKVRRAVKTVFEGRRLESCRVTLGWRVEDRGLWIVHGRWSGPGIERLASRMARTCKNENEDEDLKR